MKTKRIFIFKGILWFFAGLAAAVAVTRFARGLGATTALSDSTPWGLWIGFDVMGGVALAAGGFVMAAVVHIFHRDKYHPAARPAILTAFLGYGAVAVGLLFDLGLPWHIWHPMIFWNIHSPLFEVAWCVMLYLTVLALEVAPTILEPTPFQKAWRFFKKLALPVMILGIMLSTLHQSSLGSLLLIMPFRLHPLWYTHLLPELFFVSAICLGINMVIFESSVTSWLYRREPETEMLSGLGRISAIALSFYFIFRMVDIALQHKLGLIFAGTWESNLFIVEILMSAVIPIVFFSIPAVRRSPTAVWLLSSCSVLGFVLNRVNAAGLVQVWATRNFYFPAWTEFAISIGIVSACAIVFFFIQEHFPVDPHGLEKVKKEREQEEKGLPVFGHFSEVWLGEGWRKSLKVYSLLFAIAMAVGFTAIPTGGDFVTVPVKRARGRENLRLGAAPHYVYFDHKTHQNNYGGDKACVLCHHLHKPMDVGTPCSECHRSLYTTTNIFSHSNHITNLKGEASCVKCHGESKPVTLNDMKKCSGCHSKDMMTKNPVVKTFKKKSAPSYKNAMHKMCIPCHVKEAGNPTYKRPNLGRCGACHNSGTLTEKAFSREFSSQ